MRYTIAIAVAALVASAAHAQQADIEKGKSQFGQCRACHTLEPGKNGVGPSLYGVFGRTAGTAPNYAYSSAVKSAGEKGLKWDDATISAYITNPREFLKKYLGVDQVANKMPMNFPDPQLRANVIAYLKEASKPK
jgi:cytochrome c